MRRRSLPRHVARPDPLDSRASVLPLRHASSLDVYRRLTDEPAVSWREANDKVGRLGGWRAYAREAQQAEPSVPSAAAAKPAAVPDPATPPSRSSDHSGHHGQAAP